MWFCLSSRTSSSIMSNIRITWHLRLSMKYTQWCIHRLKHGGLLHWSQSEKQIQLDWPIESWS